MESTILLLLIVQTNYLNLLAKFTFETNSSPTPVLNVHSNDMQLLLIIAIILL